jgi:hypothetical protein
MTLVEHQRSNMDMIQITNIQNPGIQNHNPQSPRTQKVGPQNPQPQNPRPRPSVRHDGWTAAKQRSFCETLAECGQVERAAQAVGMSRESAYRLRRREGGRAFALAWDAALRLAVSRLVDDTFELAFEGAVEQIIKDGEVVAERRRKDPRIMLATIERLNKLRPLASPPAVAIAQEFDTFLDCLEADVETGSEACACFMMDRGDTLEDDPDEDELTALALLMTRGRDAEGPSEEPDSDEDEDDDQTDDHEAEEVIETSEGQGADAVGKPVTQNRNSV